MKMKCCTRADLGNMKDLSLFAAQHRPKSTDRIFFKTSNITWKTFESLLQGFTYFCLKHSAPACLKRKDSFLDGPLVWSGMASPIFLYSYQIICSNLSDNGWVPIVGKKIFYHSISQCTELNYVRLSVVTLNNLRLYHMSKDTTQCNV